MTPRELDVLTGIGRGLSNDEIAAELYLSVNSVKTHLRTLFAKLGVASRTQAALWLLRHGDPTAAEDAELEPPCGTVACRQLVDRLRRRADARERVGMAKGIVMVEGPTDVAGATSALTREAQRSTTGLPDLADELVDAYDRRSRPAVLSARLERLLDESRRAQEQARAVRSEARRVKSSPVS